MSALRVEEDGPPIIPIGVRAECFLHIKVGCTFGSVEALIHDGLHCEPGNVRDDNCSLGTSLVFLTSASRLKTREFVV